MNIKDLAYFEEQLLEAKRLLEAHSYISAYGKLIEAIRFWVSIKKEIVLKGEKEPKEDLSIKK